MIFLAEMIDEHDVGVVLIYLGVEHVAAVGRNGHAFGEVSIGLEDFTGAGGGEIKKGNGAGIVFRSEIDAIGDHGPLRSLEDFGHLRNLLGSSTRAV